MLWRPWTAAVGVTNILEHRAVALDVQHAGSIMRLVSFYAPAEGSFNEKVLFLQKFVGLPQVACIANLAIAGDFNLEAKEVASIVADTHFLVGATAEPTCFSSSGALASTSCCAQSPFRSWSPALRRWTLW